MKSIAFSRFATVYASVPLLVIAVLLARSPEDPHATRRWLQQAVGPRDIPTGPRTRPFTSSLFDAAVAGRACRPAVSDMSDPLAMSSVKTRGSSDRSMTGDVCSSAWCGSPM
jgi:hypothetical protein